MIPGSTPIKDEEGGEREHGPRKESHDKAELGHLEHAATAVNYTPETDEPPNGGARAWLQVFASHLMNALAWGYAAAYGVYQLHYTETMGLPRAKISWIGSIQIFLTSAICTVSGRLTDAGYARESAIVGSAMAVFGTFMTSLAKTYWQILLAQGVCTGLGLGLLFIPAITVASTYFTTKRSFAMSIAAMGTGTGSVVFPATVQYLIPRVGFPWAVRCSAFVVLTFAVAGVALLKPRLPPRKSGPWVEWGAFKEVPYLLFAAGMFLLFWALYFGFFYVSESMRPSPRSFAHVKVQINVFAHTEVGFSSTGSVALLLITNAMSIPARPAVGYIADNVLGPLNTMATGIFLLGTMFFAWTGVTTKTGLYVFSVFFGIANGAAQGVFPGALASLTKDQQKAGTRFGMVAAVIGCATLAGPPTAGAIIDASNGSFFWAQLWGGTVIICASLTVFASRFSKTGWKLKKFA